MIPPKPIIQQTDQSGPSVLRKKNLNKSEFTKSENRKSYIENLEADDEPVEENEFQKYSKESFKALLNKFDQKNTSNNFMNGSITRRNVSIKLLPGNVDFEVEEKFETINSSSSSPPLTPVTPLSPTHKMSPMVQEETATMKRNTNSVVTSSTSSTSSTTAATSASTSVTSYSTSLTSSGTNSSINQSTSNRLESIDLNEFEEMQPIEEEEDDIWENLDAQLADTVNIIKNFNF